VTKARQCDINLQEERWGEGAWQDELCGNGGGVIKNPIQPESPEIAMQI